MCNSKCSYVWGVCDFQYLCSTGPYREVGINMYITKISAGVIWTLSISVWIPPRESRTLREWEGTKEKSNLQILEIVCGQVRPRLPSLGSFGRASRHGKPAPGSESCLHHSLCYPGHVPSPLCVSVSESGKWSGVRRKGGPTCPVLRTAHRVGAPWCRGRCGSL